MLLDDCRLGKLGDQAVFGLSRFSVFAASIDLSAVYVEPEKAHIDQFAREVCKELAVSNANS